MAQDLIARGRIGCVPGADFGANGEGYIRFCFARDRRELTGALESMSRLGIGVPRLPSVSSLEMPAQGLKAATRRAQSPR